MRHSGLGRRARATASTSVSPLLMEQFGSRLIARDSHLESAVTKLACVTQAFAAPGALSDRHELVQIEHILRHLQLKRKRPRAKDRTYAHHLVALNAHRHAQAVLRMSKQVGEITRPRIYERYAISHHRNTARNRRALFG